MHRRHLTFFHKQKLLRIRLGVSIHFQIPIADCDQRKSHLVEFPQAVIRNIPSQHIVPDLIIFRSLCLPFFSRPLTEGGNLESMSLYHLLHMSDLCVYF